MNTICNICGGNASKIFDALVLGKYTSGYHQCKKCGFIQTDKPYWLKEAYASAISSLDVGLIYRNLDFSNIIPSVLDLFSGKEDSYIDYGGGYGIFVRIMRDKGYDFYLDDIYAENLFAKYFELKNHKGNAKFAALTAFEVFEHLEDPVSELKKMFELSDTVIFSTELQPQSSFSNSGDWWYFVPEIGQHISFYNLKSLEVLSQQFNCRLHSNGSNLHMLTKLNLQRNPFSAKAPPPKSIMERIMNRMFKKPVETIIQRPSLLQPDFELYKSNLNNIQ